MIPFCEWFLIPYLLWHVSIFVLAFYTWSNDRESFRRMMRFFIVCSCIVLPIYVIYPSCQNMRPESFTRDSLLTQGMALIYALDTSTNVCPSMHVIGSLGLLFTVWRVKPLQKPAYRTIIVVLVLLICVSTVFVKQHSALDILFALPVSFIGWFACFREKGVRP